MVLHDELREPANPRWSSPILSARAGDCPIVATALHDGHAVRPSLVDLLAIDERTRLREEDPYSGYWTTISDSRIVAKRSRFEVDLNRSEQESVYTSPDKAWGLDVWVRPPDADALAKSHAEYRHFYAVMHHLLSGLIERYGGFVVLDLHSYNHRRAGPNQPPEPPRDNPEVNVGTGWLDRDRWGSLVDRFMRDLRAYDFFGTELDVRENVRFRGGYFARWVGETFPQRGAVLAVELKKFYMDEWSGEADDALVIAIRQALLSTLPGLSEELEKRVARPAWEGGEAGAQAR